MAIERAVCVHHPDRHAIGICVITHKHICSECATKIEGVSYSKEGLAILAERRASEARSVSWGARVLAAFLFVGAILNAGFLYEMFRASMIMIIDLEQSNS